jgi:hypothetical protein
MPRNVSSSPLSAANSEQTGCPPSADAGHLIKKSLVDVGLLGCDAVRTSTQIPKFRRNIKSPFSSLKTNIDVFTFQKEIPYYEIKCTSPVQQKRTNKSYHKPVKPNFHPANPIPYAAVSC